MQALQSSETMASLAQDLARPILTWGGDPQVIMLELRSLVTIFGPIAN